MNKEQLLEAGLTEAQANEVLKLHKQSIDGQFVPKHRFDEVNNELKTTREQLADRDKQIDGLKKFQGDSEQLAERIKELEKANADKDSQHKEVLLAERKRNAVKLELMGDDSGKPHDVDMVMGLFDLDKVVFDEATGKITDGYTDQLAAIRQDKAFLFSSKPAGTPQGWKPKGSKPQDGDGVPPVETSELYGSSLAQTKLAMMGITPQNTTD